MFKKLFLGLSLSLIATTAFSAPVDLSTWKQAGGGSWSLQGGNTSVLQNINTPDPAVFYNDMDSQGLALSGTIKVQTTTDDDFIGFVLGYHTGDNTNASADYLLVDWKQGNQALATNVYGNAGLAISRVTGVFDFNEFWDHSGVVTELQRGATLGSTGWADNTEYSFDLEFTATNVMVKVNGVTELNITGTFNNGSFGFYNLSQERVLYAGIEEDIAFCEENPKDIQCQGGSVPVPAPLALIGLGLIAAGFSVRKKIS